MTAPLFPFTIPIPVTEASCSESISIRGVNFVLPHPHPSMRACVVVPVRNEEAVLPSLLTALAEQCTLTGASLGTDSFEVILLLNNCTDLTREVADDFEIQHRKRLKLHITEVDFLPEEAYVGRARQALFDLALHRFQLLRKPQGLILTTDADSCPACDWIAQNEAEIATGVSGVGGRIVLHSSEEAALPAQVWRFLLLDIGYRRAMEEIRSLYVPEAHDPFPRHHQHFGGSLAVTADAYKKAGGMPLRRSNEDVALYHALIDSGQKFRHSYRARVSTSARMIGRAQGGLADALNWWNDQAMERTPVMVESATDAERRLATLALWHVNHPAAAPPANLTTPPEPPAPGTAVEIHVTLRALRKICEELRALPFTARIDRARGLCSTGIDQAGKRIGDSVYANCQGT